MDQQLLYELRALEYLQAHPDIFYGNLFPAYRALFGNNLSKEFLLKFRSNEYFDVTFNNNIPKREYPFSTNEDNSKYTLNARGKRQLKILKDKESHFSFDLKGKKFYYQKRWMPFIISIVAAGIAGASLAVSICTCNLKERQQEQSKQQEVTQKKSEVPKKNL